MYVYTCNDKKSYFDLFQGPIFRDRYLLEWYLAKINHENESFTLPGICMACQQPVNFLVDRSFGARLFEYVWHPNWRERQVCPLCGLNSRQRAAVAFVSGVAHNLPERRPTFYLTEQITPIFQHVQKMLPDIELIGSEYLGPDVPLGTVKEGVRHEDLQQLSLKDQSVDLVVTNDVAEHVPSPQAAFRELCRVLKPGGQVFMTTPFACDNLNNVTRASIVDGKLVHHLPAAYHGNPLSGASPSLVFTDFGWEILAQLREAGFSQASVKIFWSYQYGHLGIPQEFFHAVK
jgi:SAM-dependent methyltransferase